MRITFTVITIVFILLLITGFLLPGPCQIPVQGADKRSWHAESFWYRPWGPSGVHKGIDIFAPKGRAVVAASYGWVIYRGEFGAGGHVVAVLGPKWRIHYYAHLLTSEVDAGDFIGTGQKIGQVGNSGNASKKPPHLHYSLISLMPYVWLWDGDQQGWKKMFYLDPGRYLAAVNVRR